MFIARLVAIALLLSSISFSAKAADPAPAVLPSDVAKRVDSGFSAALSPYLWGAGIKGDVGQFGLPTVQVDASFLDILSSLDFAAMLVGEARYNRFSVFSDLNYIKISTDETTPLGILASKIELDSETLRWSLMAGYDLLRSDRARLDLTGGIQLWNVDSTLSFTGGLLNGRSRKDNNGWADGIAGLRGRFDITPNWYLTGWGFIGAGESDLTWDALGGVGYSFNDRISAVVGYRALSVDFSEDRFVFDVIQHGLIAGGVIRF